jgi:hypothetical protein
MQTTTLDLAADIIDVRDIIDRVEQLDPEFSDIKLTDDETKELAKLRSILAELVGYGGDEQWRGDWYPGTLISERAFEDHVREMLEDCGTIPKDLPWFVAIDWETTAQHVQGDYTPVQIDGITYWYR